ncbi:bifunctional RNase H/acid phosphatase [Streptomyces dubilierae]|uniref:Bifunctional RNase H/acid phosphatase n=1 Tax=Streptomyces dubilierae TaxID=3075533 RepID=A0ABU2PDX6_9ACTN|nr:bifunctional RNase H/acid phosphatase [Streptomyces sp. DSM 41921]MDT0390369.1 bifunctional RNase H/acid phosphatase [Streptomyces sp. DSM 41921]
MREFIVEADGGSRGNPGPAGYGAVVSDAATGRTLREAAEYIGVATNNVAEYRGLLAGLRAAHELDPAATVRVRMDSKLVVEQMSGRWKIKHPAMKPLAAEAARIFPPGRVTYEWIPRERNKHADRLANEAMDARAKGEQWSESSSTAELDTARTAPAEPPGDATAGAARVRDALAAGRATTPTTGSGPDPVPSSAREATGLADGEGREAALTGTDARTDRPGGAVRPAAAAADARAARAVAVGGTGTADAGAHAVEAEASAGGRTPKPGSAAQAHADGRVTKVVAAPGWAPADMGAPATFVLLRHGETPLTPQKRFSGSGGTDPSLSDVGREQAERAGALLARRGTIQAVVSSPLARTRETAGIVAARLGLDVEIEDGLRETDFGAWEGLTFAEVRERHPDDLNAWLASPDAEPTGGGESFAATAERIAVTRDKLIAAHRGRTVLLVTHVTPIKTFVRLALGAPPESLFRMELSAASLSAVAYYADGNASVRLFNDTSHLR